MPGTGDHKLNRYLGQARSHATSNPIDTLVVGNEAADLDSIATAFVLAYILGKQKKKPLALPLIPISRDDFRLRTEAVYVLGEAKIDLALVLFLDDIAQDADAFRQFLNKVQHLTLVDHNRLSGRFEPYADKVSHIVDHHENEGFYPRANRTIEPVGSCATLAGELLIKECPGAMEPHIATLLLGTILLDTVNLDPKAGRVTPKDISVAQALEPFCQIKPDSFYQAVREAKFSIKGLDTRDLLRKDYKEFSFGQIRCGIASVPISLTRWKDRDPNLGKNLETWAHEKNLDILVTMSAWSGLTFSRDLGVYTCHPNDIEPLIAMLQSNGLDLTPLKKHVPCDTGKTVFFNQGNSSISRKKLVPLLSEFFSV